MLSEIKVPSLGESESEATLIAWHVKEGDQVEIDEVLAEIESDKITMEITALDAGLMKSVSKQEGDSVTPGEVLAVIDTEGRSKKQKEVKSKASIPEMDQTNSNVRAEPAVETTIAQVAQGLIESLPNNEKDATNAGVRQRTEERIAMSSLRRRIATRLKEAQNNAAILTTFNELNMQPVMELRSRYRDTFKQKYGVDLGFMSFFIRACCDALAQFPAVNAAIEGDDILYHDYCDIGVAVSSEKGLVVPVIRDAGFMSLAELENAVGRYAKKAREGGLLPGDLKGGTFSISNGGVFGSMLSTPILNPPQSAILGMHAIKKRAVVEGDQIVVRPMMYLALSYDHRLIDGREAVQFLVAVKESLEFPGKSLLGV
ncbi:MAG: dihydrolipoyllysine-residue succinyltransferase [Mariprofundaceae bacterium]